MHNSYRCWYISSPLLGLFLNILWINHNHPKCIRYLVLFTAHFWQIILGLLALCEQLCSKYSCRCFRSLSPDLKELILSSNVSDCELKIWFLWISCNTYGKVTVSLVCYDVCGKLVQKVTGVRGSHLKMGFLDFQDFQQTSQPTTPRWKSVGHCNSISLGLKWNVPPLPY